MSFEESILKISQIDPFSILLGVMVVLVIVELILTKAIFSLKKGLDNTRNALNENLKLAEDSTDAIKFIAGVIKSGSVDVNSEKFGKLNLKIHDGEKKE